MNEKIYNSGFIMSFYPESDNILIWSGWMKCGIHGWVNPAIFGYLDTDFYVGF